MGETPIMASTRLIFVALLLLVLFVYNTQAGEKCKRGTCVLTKKECKTSITGLCDNGKLCCRIGNRRGDGLKSKPKKKKSGTNNKSKPRKLGNKSTSEKKTEKGSNKRPKKRKNRGK